MNNQIIKSSVAALVLFFAMGGASVSKEKPTREVSQIVYICTGPKAETYHKSKDCRGLNRCSGSIRAISLDKAKEMRRRACKICY